MDKRNERVRRRRAEKAASNPEQAAERRSKEAERKRLRRTALQRPHAGRQLNVRGKEQVIGLATYIRDKKDFTVARCFNPTTLKWTSLLMFSDLERMISAELMFTDSIIDWHCSAVAEGLGVDRSSVRLMSCATTNMLFNGQNNFERVRYDHLSKTEKKESNPKSALAFDKLVFPVCIREHWVAVSVEPPSRTVKVYDSLQNNPKRLQSLRKVFDQYIQDQGNQGRKYKTVQVAVPQQNNSIDCGVYMADRIAALLGCNGGAAICQNQTTVYQYRAKMFFAATERMHSNLTI